MAYKVSLSLGLISIPARVDKATNTPTAFKTVCLGNGDDKVHEPTAIRQPQWCPHCELITDPTLLKKGVAVAGGFVLVDQDTIAEAKSDTALRYKGKVALVAHPAEEFLAATAQGKALNYLSPEPNLPADNYALLVALIEAHPELAFVSLYTPVSKQGLFLARVKDGVLVLEERVLQDNLRDVPTHDGTANPALLAQFEAILPMLVTDFDPASYADDYADTIAALVAESDVVAVEDTSSTKTTAPVAMQSDDTIAAALAELAKSVKKPRKARAKKPVAA